MTETPRKVLVLGSGAIKIGEAAEFDYSGSQALKALREEGIETVLVNPNIATIQTSYHLADHVYLGPLQAWFVKDIIKKETPDAILLGFGGQTALSLGVELYDKGILREYDVKILGTPIEGIRRALSRSLFREAMLRKGLPVPPSSAVSAVEEALEAAEDIGYPVIVRVSFNLGGGGSLIAYNEKELMEGLGRAFAQAGIREVLVERYLKFWKEIEFEVVRDYRGTMAAVACLENMDPMGVHTGESIVVAPCQTLSDLEFQSLRWSSLKVAETISLVGEGNVQLALDPFTGDASHYIIETNPRMSRSSSLASKATGYPLAYIAAKLALGYRLEEITNKVTGKTCSCFEPSLDYVVVKIPRWDLSKFPGVEARIGSEMKSIGEVMAVGRSLREAIEKAIRMLDIGYNSLLDAAVDESLGSLPEAIQYLRERRPYWLLYAARAFHEGATIQEVYEATGVDPYFLDQIREAVEDGSEYKGDCRFAGHLLRNGFHREWIECNVGEEPKAKMIDTLAGEWPSRTGYLYMTYDSYEHDLEPLQGDSVLIIGAGVFRIGVSVEFDWGVVSFSEEAERLGYKSIVVNYNPETVSTDWDVSSRLYFEEITGERIEDIYRFEKPQGIVAFLGGQISNNLALELERYRKLPLLGTPGSSVDRAENRSLFSKLLEELGIRQPEWAIATSPKEALEAAEDIGYPVIARPSYVISGSSMSIARTPEELYEIVEKASRVSPKYPVVLARFIENAIEAEIDAVGDSVKSIGAVIEHVEPAGVHSGDSTMILPSRSLSEKTKREMMWIAQALNRELEIRGPYNIQFLIQGETPYVIELNLRASRSMPYTSKSTGYSLIKAAVEASLKNSIETLPDWNHTIYEGFHLLEPQGYYSVKSPQFSWERLKGAYPYLGPEMRSTGEVAAQGVFFEEALLKSWASVKGNIIPAREKPILVYDPTGLHREEIAETGRILEEAGYTVMTPGLAGDEDYTVSLLKKGEIGLLVTTDYTPEIDYKLRRTAADYGVPLVLNHMLGRELARALLWYWSGGRLEPVELREYWGRSPVGVL